MNAISCKKTWVVLIALAALGVCATNARADGVVGVPPMVALGSDYFQTQPGTSFDFGPGIGVVSFMGLAIGPGLTDTIVQRQMDATINGGAIPIELVALSLQSTAPVNIGGSFFDVFVTLNPDPAVRSTGSMTIMGGLGGGTFDSFFDVFFDAHFLAVGGGSGFDIFTSVGLGQSGGVWSPTPSPGAVLVPGVDEGAGDQAANLHSSLDPNEVDFFVGGTVKECSLTGGCHFVTEAQTPEPGTLLLLGTGLAGLGRIMRKKRSRKA